MQDELTPKHAFVTGITGQDGRYLTELLLAAGYRVTGLVRNSAATPRGDGVAIVQWDMRDADGLSRLLSAHRPDEFYNLAAFSTGAGMFDDPVAIGDINGLAVVRILEAIRTASPNTRFCQASSAEIFGAASGSPQSESSRPDPRSPYGAAKLFAQTMVEVYRRRHGLFACAAILFNHESPLRPDAFVTRKVTRAAAASRLGIIEHVVMGDLASCRDWGFAGDYVRAMWLMLQQSRANDYVIATGITHSVADLCQLAFNQVGLDYREFVRSKPRPDREPEPLQLVGDAHKAARELGWVPTVPFQKLIAQMVDNDLALLSEKGCEIQ